MEKNNRYVMALVGFRVGRMGICCEVCVLPNRLFFRRGFLTLTETVGAEEARSFYSTWRRVWWDEEAVEGSGLR